MALVGARGASEFWARSKLTDGNIANYLNKTGGLEGITNTKTYSAVFCGKLAAGSNTGQTLLSIQNTGSGANSFRFIIASSNIDAIASNADDAIICYKAFNSPPADFEEKFFVIMVMADTATSTLRLWLNGTEETGTVGTFVNDVFNLAGANCYIGIEESSGTKRQAINGNQSMTYFTTDYIDFSQEENRNLFVDQLGYPKDLKAQIDKGLIPEPLIYLPFDDPDNLGKNLGTGGDFTVVGTVTAGADFTL